VVRKRLRELNHNDPVQREVDDMQIKEVMTPSPEVISPEASLAEAATMMKRLDVGSLPVGSNDSVVGWDNGPRHHNPGHGRTPQPGRGVGPRSDVAGRRLLHGE
jgi:CBS domain